MREMRALSVRQPWAELIVSGRKTIELRKWYTSYRGLLWLHTGKAEDKELGDVFGLSGLFHGGYLGTVDLRAVVRVDRERWQSWRDRHLDRGPYQRGHFAWVLSSPIRFKQPISGPGNRGLYEPGAAQEALLREAFRSAAGAAARPQLPM